MLVNRIQLPTTSFCFYNKRWLSRKPAKPGKPPILPPSKSKLYRITPTKWLKPEDVADLLWRRHIYNSAVLTMRRVFREEYEQQKKECIGLDRVQKEVDKELDRLLAENDKRNEELAKQRAERELETHGKLEAKILKEIERRLEIQTKNVEQKTAEVLKMIEKSKDFITIENMDEKIRHALENPVNFDYAIDLVGEKLPNPMPPKYFTAIRAQQKRLQDTTAGFVLKKVQKPETGEGGDNRKTLSKEEKAANWYKLKKEKMAAAAEAKKSAEESSTKEAVTPENTQKKKDD